MKKLTHIKANKIFDNNLSELERLLSNMLNLIDVLQNEYSRKNETSFKKHYLFHINSVNVVIKCCWKLNKLQYVDNNLRLRFNLVRDNLSEIHDFMYGI